MKGAKPAAPAKFRKRNKYPWFPPVMIGVMVLTVHAAFLAFHVVPQARMLFNGVSKDLYPGIKAISQQTFFIEVGLHFFATTMFIVCFLRAVFTKPGAVSTEQTPWKNGQFKILPKDEQKFQALLLGPNIGQFAAGQDSQSYLREYVGKNRAYLMAQSLDKSESKLKEEEYWNSWLEFLKNFPVVNRRWPQEKDKEKGVPDGLMRQCTKSPCGQFKPDRSHHCRECNRCVLRMDHHCPWINNCVGFHTYKYFILVLFYAVMASLSVLIPLLPYVSYDIGDTREVLAPSDIIRSFSLVTTCLMTSFISVGCTWFGGHHVFLILQGMTTIEWKESARALKDVKVRNHRFSVAHGKFHMSALNNVRHVMGEWYIWLLPIAAQDQHGADGMYLEGRREEDISVCC